MEEQSEEPSQTYAYETEPNSEVLLEVRKKEIKELRKKAAIDKQIRLTNNARKRVIRDDKLDKINQRLKIIKSSMVKYNRAGKIERDSIDIFERIINLINNDIKLDIELDSEISEDNLEVSQEEIEAEAVEESEVNPQN